ncbi:hypothetical protein C8F01DRAFT_777313 [Mycena amicta]|nr:hypothetical protein C8F01DRAFT_777313 [Mycena amicta]
MTETFSRDPSPSKACSNCRQHLRLLNYSAGVAVYIYGIDVVDPANITFAMSNPPISAFHYKDSGGGFIYDSLFFSADGLDGTTQHTVTWNEKSNSISGGGAGLFDYAVVTVDKSATSSQPSTSASGSTSSSSFPSAINSESGGLTSNTRKSNAGIFAGGVIGSLALLSLLAAVVYYCLRRRSRSASSLLMRITSRSSVLHPDHFVEPFQVPQSSRTTYTSSLPARASTIPPIFVSTVTPQNPKGLSSWGTPSPSSLAHARDAEVEQRLRNLEAMVAERGPPAYV